MSPDKRRADEAQFAAWGACLGPHASEADRPIANKRSHSGLDNILPASIVKSSKSISRSRPSATPLLERSISSMTDSFILEHKGRSQSYQPESESVGAVEKAPNEDDGLTPISNWAHLSYIKTQRNNLRTELTAQQIAGAEVKRSVTSLRRLAFRMAVNISVKEKQIATSVRHLASSRKSHYLQGKNAEQRLESLQRALRVEECRNAEILGALENASMLTMQYSAASSENEQRIQLFSPPPSPPTRNTDLLASPPGSPRTPTHPPRWHAFDLGLTPGIESPNEVRTSDSRLIRAKRESDRALTACRNRIEELQEVVERTKEDTEILQTTKAGLEEELASHRSRIASLERSRAIVEATLTSTRAQLKSVTDSENALGQQLKLQNEEIAHLENMSQDKQGIVDLLHNEKSNLEDQLKSRDINIKHLDARIAVLSESLQSLQKQTNSAEQRETSLRNHLAEKEGAHEDLTRRVERGSQYISLLEHKIKTHESQELEHAKDIRSRNAHSAAVLDQLENAETQRKNLQAALNSLQDVVASLKSELHAEGSVQHALRAELESVQIVKADMIDKLRIAKENLEIEISAKDKSRAEMDTLHLSYVALKNNLQAAQERIQSLDQDNDSGHAKLEILRDSKASLEADLLHARQSLFRLREEVRMGDTKLAEVQSTRLELEQKLQKSSEQIAALESNLAVARKAKAVDDERHAIEAQERKAQVNQLQSSILELQTALVSSSDLRTSLGKRLAKAHAAKDHAESQHREAINIQRNLEVECEDSRLQLESTTRDRDTLRAELDQLECSLNTSRHAASDLETRLKANVEETKGLMSTIRDLEAALNSSHDVKTETVKALAIAVEHGENSKAEIASLQGDLHGMKAANEDSEAKLREASNHRVELEIKNDAAMSKLLALERQNAEVKSQLERAQDEVAQLEGMQKSTQGRVASMERSYNKLDKKSRALEAHLSVIEPRAKEWQAGLALAEEELTALYRSKAEVTSRLTRALESNAELQKELNDTERARIDTESRLHSATNSVHWLQSELDTSHSRALNAHNEITRLTSELDITHEAQRHLEEQLTAATNLTIRLQSQLSAHHSSADGAHKDIARLESALEIAEQSKREVEEQLVGATELAARLQSEMIASRSLADHACEDNARLASELERVQQCNKELETRFVSATDTNARLETDLKMSRSAAETACDEKARLNSELSHAMREVGKIQELKDNLEKRLDSAETNANNLEKDLFLSRSVLQMTAAEAATLTTRLGTVDAKLVDLQRSKIELEEKLKLTEHSDSILRAESSSLTSRVAEAEASRASLTSQLVASKAEFEQNRSVQINLENCLRSTSQRNEELEKALHIANVQLDTAKQESLSARDHEQKIALEIGTLREANTKLEISEKGLLARLTSAEKDLSVVRETNANLEAFLDRVEVDMVAAEAAVAASETRLAEFIEESQSRIDAAGFDKTKHMSMSISLDKDSQALVKENAKLHEKIGAQVSEIGDLHKVREKMAQDLSDKDSYIMELGTSSEKRLKSMHSAYNELRKKHKELENDVRQSSIRKAEATATEQASTMAGLEQKVRDLEDDKRTLKKLVRRLKEKTRGLEVLEEGQEANDYRPVSSSPRRVAIRGDQSHSVASSPHTQHSGSPRSGSLYSQSASNRHYSIVHDRPTTRQSTFSQDDALDAWARDVERVRMLRDETAVQLEDLKKSRQSLKKSLKETELQLHRLEKQQSSKHQRALLRKNRPPTPCGMHSELNPSQAQPQTPTRPATSAGLYFTPVYHAPRHGPRPPTPESTARADTLFPQSDHRHWSMIPKAVISHRPSTSHSFKNKVMGRKSSDEEQSTERSKEKRRWSSGLRTFFRADS
ncbi:hypothetical protein ACN47E_006197 [Coniothyrium glycines]